MLDGESAEACIFGVTDEIWLESESQNRKYLLLFEMASGVFFLSFYTWWERVPRTPNVNFDVENDIQAKKMSDEAYTKMDVDWGNSPLRLKLGNTLTSLNVQARDHPPPSIKVMRF